MICHPRHVRPTYSSVPKTTTQACFQTAPCPTSLPRYSWPRASCPFPTIRSQNPAATTPFVTTCITAHSVSWTSFPPVNVQHHVHPRVVDGPGSRLGSFSLALGSMASAVLRWVLALGTPELWRAHACPNDVAHKCGELDVNPLACWSVNRSPDKSPVCIHGC